MNELIKVTELEYKTISELLLKSIGDNVFANMSFNATIQNHNYTLAISVIVSRNESNEISSIIPIWWELSKHNTDFHWRELQKHLPKTN